MPRPVRSALAALLAALAVGAVAAGCGGGDDSALTLVAYSTPREVYEELIPRFQRTPAGEGVTFEQSYGASGEQRRQVEAGLESDVVAFSLEPDMTALVEEGLVAEGWNADPFGGMVSNSVVVLAVREGNPKGIRDWDDLLRDDVEVITPNPFSSGGAQWNVMAAYGAQLARGASEREGLQFIERMFQNVPVQSPSAREALQVFTSGRGDVLLAYENEAILAQRNGEPIEYVIPDSTLLIENPIAAVAEGDAETAEAFVTFATSPESQRLWGEKGYRPVDPAVAREFSYPEPPGLFTIDDDLGGWERVRSEFFDPETGSVGRILQRQGVPLE